MTINATAPILLCLYVAVGEKQGVPLEQALGHGPERHPQGVHRARHVHLPARAVAAADHRHVRLLREEGAEVEHDLHQRLPHPRGRLDGGAGDRLHARRRHRLRRGGADARASRSTSSPARLSFFFNVHNNFLEEVAKFRAARRLWARIMKERFKAKDPRSMMLRFHAQTAGSTLTAQQPRQQRRARGAAGAGGGARRRAVAAHQPLRRGAGAAHRGGGAAGAAHAADHRPRDRASPTSSIRSAAATRSRR